MGDCKATDHWKKFEGYRDLIGKVTESRGNIHFRLVCLFQAA